MSRFVAFGVAAILLLITLFAFTPVNFAGDLGICLPSPNQWHLPKFLGWLINTGLISLSVIIMASANKKYNFIPEVEPMMSMILLLTLACNCLTTSVVSSSTLLLLCNVLCLYIIITTYEQMNATREFFIVASLPAIGAMFQEAFVLMIPVYIGGGLMMKSFRLREFIAFIFGLIAPYWIAVGMGMISIDAFHFPQTLSAFSATGVNSKIFLTLLAICIMGVLGLIMALYNGVRLFNRNSRLRCMHFSFNIMGLVAILALIFNFNNFEAYYGTIALWFAIQTATLLNLYNVRRSLTVICVTLAIFLPLYFIAL